MPRLLLSDELWSKLRGILLHKAIYNKRGLRMTVVGTLYRMLNALFSRPPPERHRPRLMKRWSCGDTPTLPDSEPPPMSAEQT